MEEMPVERSFMHHQGKPWRREPPSQTTPRAHSKGDGTTAVLPRRIHLRRPKKQATGADRKCSATTPGKSSRPRRTLCPGRSIKAQKPGLPRCPSLPITSSSILFRPLPSSHVLFRPIPSYSLLYRKAAGKSLLFPAADIHGQF